jgi:hypothetical protein
MKKLFLCFLLLPLSAFAAGGGVMQTAELLNANAPANTTCVRNAFVNALYENADKIDEDAPESAVKQWIYDTIQSAETLGDVLTCPEIMDADENETIRFLPIQYTFPNGREIIVNYETQAHVLEQRFMLATKTELPTTDPNPAISEFDETATWTNTEPAWYGIMVVQSDALRDMVGPDKNNTVSMEYIIDNIGNLYPRDTDGVCSTRSGMTAKLRNSMIHKVMHEHTAKHDDDNNNYYIAGDINLRWISFAEIALDIALTVVSFGGFAAAEGAVKMARATKIIGKIGKNMKTLTKIENVQKYIRESLKIARLTKEIDNMNDMTKTIKTIDKLEKALAKLPKGSAKYEKIAKQLDAARKLKADNMWKFGQTGSTTVKTMTRSQAKNLTDIENRINKIESIDASRRTAKDADTLKKLRQERNSILNKVGTKDPSEIARLKQSALNGSIGTIFTDIDITKFDDLTKVKLEEIEKTKKTMSDMARADKNVAEYVKQFDELKKVTKYVRELKTFKKARTGNMVSRAWQGLKNTGKSIKTANTGGKMLDNAAKVAEQGAKSINKLDKAHIDDLTKSFKNISKLEKDLERATKGSEKYQKLTKELTEAKKLHTDKIAKLGKVGENIKSLKDLDALKDSTRATKHSLRAGRARDWLFHSTMRNAGRVAKVGEELAALHFVLGILGDFYDWTNTENDEFTNGINMKPLLLLSADDIEGQDNIVNYGMWLMWSGDSAIPEDDDAAYLQAMDFAQKFYQDLVETQESENHHACDVDIYVVRPIIRNPGGESQSLYWLFMNDIPWSTAR